MAPNMDKVVLIVGILCFVQISYAIMCYDCNSEYDPRCGNPFQNYSIGVVNCSKQEPLEHLKDKYKPVLCRKTVQKVYGKTRVVRGCGYIPDENTDNGACLKRSGTHDVQAFYCACTSDLCNDAPSILNNNKNLILNILPYTLATIFLLVSSNFNSFSIFRKFS